MRFNDFSNVFFGSVCPECARSIEKGDGHEHTEWCPHYSAPPEVEEPMVITPPVAEESTDSLSGDWFDDQQEETVVQDVEPVLTVDEPTPEVVNISGPKPGVDVYPTVGGGPVPGFEIRPNTSSPNNDLEEKLDKMSYELKSMMEANAVEVDNEIREYRRETEDTISKLITAIESFEELTNKSINKVTKEYESIGDKIEELEEAQLGETPLSSEQVQHIVNEKHSDAIREVKEVEKKIVPEGEVGEIINVKFSSFKKDMYKADKDKKIILRGEIEDIIDKRLFFFKRDFKGEIFQILDERDTKIKKEIKDFINDLRKREGKKS